MKQQQHFLSSSLLHWQINGSQKRPHPTEKHISRFLPPSLGVTRLSGWQRLLECDFSQWDPDMIDSTWLKTSPIDGMSEREEDNRRRERDSHTPTRRDKGNRCVWKETGWGKGREQGQLCVLRWEGRVISRHVSAAHNGCLQLQPDVGIRAITPGGACELWEGENNREGKWVLRDAFWGNSPETGVKRSVQKFFWKAWEQRHLIWLSVKSVILWNHIY